MPCEDQTLQILPQHVLLSLIMHLQALILPLCDMVSVLNQDGSYAPSPWLLLHSESSPPDQAAATATPAAPSTPAATPKVAASLQQTSWQDTSAVSSEQAAHLVPIAAAGSMPQNRTAWSSSAQGPVARAEIAGLSGRDWYNALVDAAIKLISQSQSVDTRLHAMRWLCAIVPQLTHESCMDLSNSGAVQASLTLIQRDSEPAINLHAALAFCCDLHQRGVLPVALLLDASLHQRLTTLLIQSGQPAG